MHAARRVDQLAGDPHPAARPAHAALEHVAHAELAADLLHVDRPAAVGEARVARDHEQPAQAGQLGGDVLDHAIGEVVLARVAAQVLERQHGDRRLVGQRGRRRRARRCSPVGRRPPWRTPRTPRPRAGSRPRHGPQQLLRLVAQRPADVADALGDRLSVTTTLGPDRRHDRVATQEPAGVLDQQAQQRERLRPQRHLGAPGGEEHAAGRVEREAREPKRLPRRPICVHGQYNPTWRQSPRAMREFKLISQEYT